MVEPFRAPIAHEPAPGALGFALRRVGTAWRRVARDGWNESAEIYGGVEIFDGLTPGEFGVVGRLFTLVEVPAGRVLGRQGTVGREFAVIVAGRLGVSVAGLPLAVLDAGCHVGELPLLHRSDPHRRATVVALERSRVGVADRREFADLIDTFPLVAQRIVAMADRRAAYLRGLADAVEHTATAVAEYPAHLSVDV